MQAVKCKIPEVCFKLNSLLCLEEYFRIQDYMYSFQDSVYLPFYLIYKL